MKKTLLFASLFAVMTANAQHPDMLKPVKADRGNIQEFVDPGFTFPANKPEIPNNNVGNQISAVTSIPLGKSANIYTILLNGQNQVAYNHDLDAVAFIHRNYQANGTNSGTLNFDVSTDGGNTWNLDRGSLNPAYTSSPTTNAARYPSLAIYNPVANSNPSNAFVVGNAPCLDATPEWGFLGRYSSKFDGTTNVSETYLITDSFNFHPYGLDVTSLGTAFSLSTRFNGGTNTALDTANYSRFFLNKGTFNIPTNDFSWTMPQVFAPNTYSYTDPTNGYIKMVNGWNIAFAPNGLTGYAVIIGAEANIGLDTVYRPIVYKTTDGGTTWNKQTTFDFSTNPVMQQYIYGSGGGSGPKRPFFSETDVTVDANGELHVFAEVLSGFSSHKDSLGFVYNGFRYLMHCKTTSTGWSVNFIDTIRSADFTLGFAPNTVSVTTRPQASRLNDGSKVFFTWVATDPTLSANNDFPDVWGIAYDVNNNWYSMPKNLAKNTGAEFSSYFATLAPISSVKSTEVQNELPIVYTVPSNTSDITQNTQHFYLKGVGFDNIEIGISESEVKSSNVSIFPNPSNGIFNVTAKAVNMNIEVVDILGNIVKTISVNNNRALVDLSNQNTGVYFIRVTANETTSTHKVILTK